MKTMYLRRLRVALSTAGVVLLLGWCVYLRWEIGQLEHEIQWQRQVLEYQRTNDVAATSLR